MKLLEALRARGDGVAVRRDDGDEAWSEIVGDAEALRSAYAPHRGGRVAMIGPNAADLLAHAAAAESEGVELHLLRRTFRDADVDRLRAAFGLASLDETPLRDASASARADVAIYTSGTTAAPKPTLHLWRDLLPRPETARRAADSTWLLAFDPATYAGVRVMTQAVAGGGTIVEPDAPTLAGVVEALGRHGDFVTAMSATPSLWRGVLVQMHDAALRRLALRQITLGGEAADQTLLDRLRATFPAARIVHVYASSEAGAVFSVGDGHAGFPADWLGRELPGGVLLTVVDGVLRVRSPAAMRSYAGEPPTTQIDTGDLVEVRGDRVVFVGRVEETINVGGAKVRPAEVEAILVTAEGVLAARVYGRASSLAGQLVAAELVAAPGADGEAVLRAARAVAKERLAPHMAPRFLEIVPALTLNESGKTVRRER
jgi:acyl-coenzyme A synthetase/AMP-(fatty) acid ligase